MAEQIYGGVLSGFLNWIGKSSPGLKTSMDSLIKIGMEVRDAKKAEEGGFIFEATGGEHTIKVKCIPLPERDGYYDVFIKNAAEKGNDQNGGKDIKSQIKEYHNIKPEQFDDRIARFFKEVYNEDLSEGFKTRRAEGEHKDEDANFDVAEDTSEENARVLNGEGSTQGNTNSSKQLHIGVKYIKASKSNPDPELQLVAVKANYDYSEALDDLNNLMDGLELTPPVDDPEAVLYYQVDVLDDELVCNECDCMETCANAAEEVLRVGYTAWDCIKGLLWSVHNPGFTEARQLLYEPLYMLESQLTTIADGYLITADYLSSPAKLIGNNVVSVDGPVSGYDAINIAMDQLRMYADALEFNAPNLPIGVQDDVGNWLQHIRTSIDYVMKRTVESPIN